MAFRIKMLMTTIPGFDYRYYCDRPATDYRDEQFQHTIDGLYVFDKTITSYLGSTKGKLITVQQSLLFTWDVDGKYSVDFSAPPNLNLAEFVEYGSFILTENGEQTAMGSFFKHENLYYLNGYFLSNETPFQAVAKLFLIPV